MGKKNKKDASTKAKLTNKAYEQELRRLQVELVHIQEWSSM